MTVRSHDILTWLGALGAAASAVADSLGHQSRAGLIAAAMVLTVAKVQHALEVLAAPAPPVKG